MNRSLQSSAIVSAVLIATLFGQTIAAENVSRGIRQSPGEGSARKAVQVDQAEAARTSRPIEITRLSVDGIKNCLMVDQAGKGKHTAKAYELAWHHRYVIRIRGGVTTVPDGKPVPVRLMCSDAEQGVVNQTLSAVAGDSLTFTTAGKDSTAPDLLAFVLSRSSAAPLQGKYELEIESCPLTHFDPTKISKYASRLLNINFGRAPLAETCGSVMGGDHDYWNTIDHGETSRQVLHWGDGEPADISLTVSPNDGEWGIAGHTGVYHAYIYHNARNVDITATISGLPAGKYIAYVMAHGDAANQNAAIEICCGDKVYSGKSTISDSQDYRSHELETGRQYVEYKIRVSKNAPLAITARRDASSLAMLNAIQLFRVKDGKKSAAVK